MAVRFCFNLSLFIKLMTRNTLLVLVFLMRKLNRKLRDVVARKLAGIDHITKTRKQKARRISRRRFHVTIRTDPRRRPFTREELPPVTIQTRRMLWKLGHIRKRRVAFADFLPVFGRKLVTRITR